MGLDTVELMLSFEDAFRINIPDSVVFTLDTPGKVIDYVYGQQPSGAPVPCLALRGFHRLRAAFVEEGACNRGEFHPAVDLNTLLPRENRRQIWDCIGARFPGSLPGLVLSKQTILTLSTKVALVAAVPAFALATAAWKFARFDISQCLTAFTMMASGFAVIAGLRAHQWSRPMATSVPKSIGTPIALLRNMLQHHPKTIAGDIARLSREQIAAVVKALTIDWCDPRKYREEAHFVRDLGLD